MPSADIYPGSVAVLASHDVAWSNLSNAEGEFNDTGATASIDQDRPDDLRLTNFGVSSIPENSHITSIAAIVRMQSVGDVNSLSGETSVLRNGNGVAFGFFDLGPDLADGGWEDTSHALAFVPLRPLPNRGWLSGLIVDLLFGEWDEASTIHLDGFKLTVDYEIDKPSALSGMSGLECP